jgi:hypothetical protein
MVCVTVNARNEHDAQGARKNLLTTLDIGSRINDRDQPRLNAEATQDPRL